MNRRISVRGIVLHEGKLLCVQLKPYKGRLRTQGGDYWCLPGGGLEDGEAVLAGVERELAEETGVRPKVGNLLYVQQFAYQDTEYLEFFFHVTNAADYLRVDLAATTHGEAEIAKIAFVDPATTHILPEFLTSEDLVQAASGNGPTRIISRL